MDTELLRQLLAEQKKTNVLLEKQGSSSSPGSSDSGAFGGIIALVICFFAVTFPIAYGVQWGMHWYNSDVQHQKDS